MVEVLGHLGGEAIFLKDAQDLAASDALHLGNTIRVTQADANLGGSSTLLGQLDDLFHQVISGDLHPRGGALAVWKAAAGDALARRVHSSHFV